MDFEPCASPTVGVEWELQLLDPETLDLRPGIMPLMEFFPKAEFVKPELVQSCVELNSCIAATSDEAIAHIANTLQKMLVRCDELGMTACGAGTHAFSRRLALITPTPRYLRLEKTAGYLAHTQITFSTHVHVGMPSGDDAMRAMSRLIPALPAFIALSANSPFWRGHETGHAAYRHRILATAPNYGLPESFSDWRAFERFLDAARSSETVRSFKDIHWDIRPHPDFGTLEIRTMDAASDLRSLNGLAAFARTMVVCMARSSDDDVRRLLPEALPVWICKQNAYCGSHQGLEADYIYTEDGKTRPLRGLIDDLISFCQPVADDIGESHGFGIAREILATGAGYLQQLESYNESDSTRAVTEDLRRMLPSPYPPAD